MLKTGLHVAYILCWSMAMISFALRDVDQANYFAIWGVVNYLLWKDTPHKVKNVR